MPAAFLSIGDASVVEGNVGTQNVAIQVSVTRPHGNNVSVNYQTANGSALAGSDYNAVSGTVSFSKNETTKTILIPIRGDRVAEPTESFSIRLSNPRGAQIRDGEGFVAITDDEPRARIDDPSIWEGNDGTAAMTFNVTLQVAYDLPVTIDFATVEGSASSGSDYIATSGTLTFQPGQMLQSVAIEVIGERSPELDETILVNLTSPDSSTTIEKGTGVGAILDNEPHITIYDTMQDYYASTITFYVSLAVEYDEVVTVDFTTWDGYAVADVDYLAASGTLTFDVGQMWQTITIDLLAIDPDPYKYFYVQLSNPSDNSMLMNDWAVGYWYYDWGYGW
jgi:hypothetical protein